MKRIITLVAIALGIAVFAVVAMRMWAMGILLHLQ